MRFLKPDIFKRVSINSFVRTKDGRFALGKVKNSNKKYRFYRLQVVKDNWRIPI
jgi:hypothetical protein